jgi:hypothetical protein
MWALLSANGNLEEAVQHMEQGMAMYDRVLHGSQAFYAVTIPAPALATTLRRTFGCSVIWIGLGAL